MSEPEIDRDSNSVAYARAHGRASALAGKPIWANPLIGEGAQHWFEAYREVPEELHGTALPPKSRTLRTKNKAGFSIVLARK